MSIIAHVKTQTLGINLRQLIENSSVFDANEAERDFWLDNLEDMDEKAKKEFAKTLLDVDKKIEKINEEHYQKMAKITTDYTAKLNRLVGEKKKIILQMAESDDHAKELKKFEADVAELANMDIY